MDTEKKSTFEQIEAFGKAWTSCGCSVVVLIIIGFLIYAVSCQ